MKQIRPALPIAFLLVPTVVNAASLQATTSKAWSEYIASANDRMEQHLSPNKSFLWLDEAPERRAKVRSGDIIVSPCEPQNPMKVPGGLIHDWIGAVFIPDTRLDDVLEVMRDYIRYKEIYQPSVVDSKLLDTHTTPAGDTRDRYSMRVINKSVLVNTAYDIDFDSRYVQMDDRRAYGVTWSTRVQEIEQYSTPRQRMMPEGEGAGIIWQLFSTTRMVERDGGVYLELEVICLSRDIPACLRWLVEPIVRRVSRSTLSTSLRQTEGAVRSRAEITRRGAGSNTVVAAARSLRPAH